MHLCPKRIDVIIVKSGLLFYICKQCLNVKHPQENDPLEQDSVRFSAFQDFYLECLFSYSSKNIDDARKWGFVPFPKVLAPKGH